MTKKQATPFRPQNAEHGFLKARLNEGGAIMLFALAILLIFCLATYSALDPAWSHTGSSSAVNNIAGTIGALIADWMFCLFGFTAYAVPVAIAYSSTLVLRGKYSDQQNHWLLQWLRAAGWLMAVLASCALAEIFIPSSSMPWGAGGIVGSLQQLIVPVLDLAGSSLLLIAVLLTGITLATGLSWLKITIVVAKFIAGCAFWLSKKIAGIKIKQSAVLAQTAIKRTKSSLQIKSKPKVIEPKAAEFVVKQVNISGNEKLPSVDLLDRATKDSKHKYSDAKLEQLSAEVEAKLADFGVKVKVVAVYPGPVITRFEMDLAPGVKVSKITGLSKDLARSLSVTAVRVVDIIPGKTVVGLELPNESREMVRLREIFESPQFINSLSPLSLALGKDIAGEPVVTDLAKMPHLLVAGTTGSGKSVGVNAMLISMLYKATAKELRLLLIDPKMLELAIYEGIPHLLAPVVTDMKDAANALRWCVAEMERRYKVMAAVGVRNLAGFNEKISNAIASDQPIKDPLWKPLTPDSEETAPLLETLPRIVITIDEFADMIMVVGKQVEELIARIAQKARAAGIHMILATQRPSVDVITGLIKANVPTRIAFQVSSRIDSRTILDQQGAENLLGNGDMLYLEAGTGIPVRVHGAFVSDAEVHSVVAMLKQMGAPSYVDQITAEIANVPGLDKIVSDNDSSDELYDEAVQIVTESRRASISYLQRRLRIGYNRAACLVEVMEQNGVVSAVQNGGSREVLAPPPVEI